MRVLVVSGSPRLDGNTELLVEEFRKTLTKKGHTSTYLHLYMGPIQACIHCDRCLDECPLPQDILTDVLKEITRYDVIVIASPIYFFGLTAKAKSFLDRLYMPNVKGELYNVMFASILVSGDNFHTGGADLVVKSLKRVCNYCDYKWLGCIFKETDDEKLPLSMKDRRNISELIEYMSNTEGLCQT